MRDEAMIAIIAGDTSRGCLGAQLIGSREPGDWCSPRNSQSKNLSDEAKHYLRKSHDPRATESQQFERRCCVRARG